MAALTTEQLCCLLKCLVANDTAAALGALPADKLPGEIALVGNGDGAETTAAGRIRISYCYISNSDPQSMPGEHWIAFYFNHHTSMLEYFDSFGMPLIEYTDIYATLSSHNLIRMCVPANRVGILQSPSSTVCGHYCVMFLYWRARHSHASIDEFSSHAMQFGVMSATQRDKQIVQQLRALARQVDCCNHVDMLNDGSSSSNSNSNDACSQACVCNSDRRQRCPR